MQELETAKRNLENARKEMNNPLHIDVYRKKMKSAIMYYEAEINRLEAEAEQVKGFDFETSKKVKSDILMMIEVLEAMEEEMAENHVYAFSKALTTKYSFPFDFFVEVVKQVATAYYTKKEQK